MGYRVGVVHRDPISEAYCSPCYPGIGSLLGFLIGKAFNWVVQINGEWEGCFGVCVLGERGDGEGPLGAEEQSLCWDALKGRRRSSR